MQRKICIFLISFFGTTVLVSATELPPENLVDSIVVQAELAVRDSNFDRAQSLLQDVLKVQKEHQLELPHSILSLCARVANCPAKVLEFTVKHLTETGRDGRYCQGAFETTDEAPKVTCIGGKPMTFEEKLILSVIDTVSIGVLIAIFGITALFLLRRLRADIALKYEFAKRRLMPLEDVWSAFYSWEGVVREILVIGWGEDRESRSKEVEDLLSRSNGLMEQSIQKAQENRFWLGEDYDKVMMFQNALIELLEACAKNDVDAMKKAESKLDEARNVIS